MIKNWAEQVPKGFAFSVKASQRITHMKRLKDVGDETEYLVSSARALGGKLGVLLFQLPPNMKKDHARIETFLKLFSEDVRIALGFRHESWFVDETFNLLRANNSPLCIADVDDDGLQVPFVSTADRGYLRLRRENDTAAELKKWFKKINDQKWKTGFVFFKHGDEGIGPKLATKFSSLV